MSNVVKANFGMGNVEALMKQLEPAILRAELECARAKLQTVRVILNSPMGAADQVMNIELLTRL